MTSSIVALVGFALLCLPGWLVALRARASLGMVAAAGIGALFAGLLLSACAAEITGYLPAWSVYLPAIILSIAAWWLGRGERLHCPVIAPIQLVLPLFCAIIAIGSYHFAFGSGEDPLIYRAWYNADWFKHLAHTQSLAHFGLPARDIFADLDRLHYYWLFYLLPGASASLLGDAQGALIATNVAIVFTFWLLLQELLCACGLSARMAAVGAFIGWAVNSIAGWGLLVGYRFDVGRLITEQSVDPGMLMEVNSYIPQHALTLCGLLAFLLLFMHAPAIRYRWPLALAPIAAAGATSTLLGASVVAIACSTMLLVPRGSLTRRAVRAVATGSLALGIVLLLQVVVPGSAGSLGSPVFESGTAAPPLATRLGDLAIRLLTTLSLALPIGLFGLWRAWRSEDRMRADLARAGALTLAIGLGATFAATIVLDDARLAGEIGLRNKYLLVIGLMVGIGLLLADPSRLERDRRAVGVALAVTVLLSLPAVVLNFVWLGWSGPRWQLAIPADDMTAMNYLAGHAPVDARVLQYPEPVSFLMGGRDSWVPIFAGRTLPGSYRSTNWDISEPIVTRAERFYSADPDARIDDDIDWVYLSRSLHPDSYGQLEARLTADPGWREALDLPGASLFARAAPADE